MKKIIAVILTLSMVLSISFGASAIVDVKVEQNDISAYVNESGAIDISNSSRYSEAECGSGKKKYVDAVNGSDSTGNGTQENPYKTIEKAKQNLSAGDTVVLKSGVYNEKIGGWQMRGTETQPITFTAEKNANVAVTAYDPISADWTKYSDNIYVANIGSGREIAHALQLKDNKFYNLIEARWPNADPDYMLDMPRAFAGKGTDNNTLCSSDLPEGDWNGATVYTWTGETWEQYVAYSRTITNYVAGQSLKFSSRVPDANDTSGTYTPKQGVWFYLTNSFAGLDSKREYYYNNTSGELFIITDDGEKPDDNEIWVKSRNYSVELWDCSYINFSNINFFGGILLGDTNYCNLDNANVYYADWFRESDGYGTMLDEFNSNRIRGTHNTWKNSEIAYTMSTGILIQSHYNTIENCVIHDVNITGGYNSAITINPNVKGTTIRKNSMYRSGRFLIYFSYDSYYNSGYEDTLIEYNDLYDAMYLTQDGGLIYAYGRDGAGVTIRYNWVHSTDKEGTRGIYIDNNCYNFKVYRNCVWDIKEAGLVLNTQSENNEIYNNTIVNCPVGVQVWPKNSDSSMKGTKIYNNIITGTHDMIEGALAPKLSNNYFVENPEIDSFLVPLNTANNIIDSATQISGVTDDYHGSAADIGAYEYGGEYWQPGANYKDDVVDGNVTFAIETDESASIRLNKKSGMRFYTTVDDEKLQKLVGNESYELGTIISLKEICGDELTIEDRCAKVVYTPQNNQDVELWEGDQFVGSIVSILEKNYSRDFVARGYVKVGDTYYYSKTSCIRNVSQIADAYIADANSGYSELSPELKLKVDEWASANDIKPEPTTKHDPYGSDIW